MYLAKAPSLGEEFILTEFHPRDMSTRDENNYLTISAENAGMFEQKLDKFTNDCRRLTHITANRFFGVREVLTEMGTAFAVSKMPQGMTLSQYIETMEDDLQFNENIIDSVYESLCSIAAEKIPLHVSSEMTYAENIASIMFMFDYVFDSNEQEMLASMAKILYTLITKNIYEFIFNLESVPLENKYRELIKGVLDDEPTITTFSEAKITVDKNAMRSAKESPLREYIGGVVLLYLIIIAIIAGAIYGLYQFASIVLG